MHYSGIVILGFLIYLTGCKTASVTSTAAEEYNEDLAGLRPDFIQKDEPKKNVPEPDDTSEPVVFEAHIKNELDSVNQLIINKNREQPYVDGFTIQIYTGNSRAEADTAVAQAIRLDPTLEPDITYHQPSYKVKVGQYTDRLEAHKVYTKIKKEFPFALLIPERIKIEYE